MVLKDLMEGVDYEIIQGTDKCEVQSVSWDSRRVKPDSLFICVRGRNVDRHEFASLAVEGGAAALVVEYPIDDIPLNINVLKVKNTREAMARIADNFYCHPSKHLNLIGITGTNGKTSVSCFIAGILETSGRKTGIIGTIENRIGNEVIKIEKLNPTTPDSIELQAILKEMLDNEVTDVAAEVTSAALVNNRVDQCHFNMGIFTNLTQDHLDEHGTMENYKNAKLKLFRMCRYGVINADDPVAADILNTGTCKRFVTYGINNSADFKAEEITYDMNGVSFILNFNGSRTGMRLNVPGKFSVYNALAAIGACWLSGLEIEQIRKGLEGIAGVRGRFEAVQNPKGCLIVVDYAHTPDGLLNILSSAREIAKRKIITVFGCGGDRDRTKRPIMGEIAGRLTDYCIITSDNPRTEEPSKILEDIEDGMLHTACRYEKIENRREAIYKALTAAEPEDIVVIAGKGHETYQIFANHTIHFDDSEVVKEFFA